MDGVAFAGVRSEDDRLIIQFYRNFYDRTEM